MPKHMKSTPGPKPGVLSYIRLISVHGLHERGDVVLYEGEVGAIRHYAAAPSRA